MTKPFSGSAKEVWAEAKVPALLGPAVVAGFWIHFVDLVLGFHFGNGF